MAFSDRPTVGDPPTLRDVASRAGVSTMTVSRALRGDRGVSPRVREHVLAVAEEVGYRRNEAARNLRLGKRNGLVGLVATNLGNPFYSRLALGVESVAEMHGLKAVIGNTGEDPSRERNLVKDLLERQVDGIIIVPADSQHDHLDSSVVGGAPVVFASRPPHGIDADCVLVDDFGGAQEATRRLIAAGHQRIGFIGNPLSVYTGAERFRGFCTALADAGLPVDMDCVVRDCVDAPSAEAAVSNMLARGILPTALFASTNRMSLGTLLATRDLDDPPAIAGFDDVEYALLLNRPLVLVDYDPDEIGRRACELLLARVRSGTDYAVAPPARVTVPTYVRG